MFLWHLLIFSRAAVLIHIAYLNKFLHILNKNIMHLFYIIAFVWNNESRSFPMFCDQRLPVVISLLLENDSLWLNLSTNLLKYFYWNVKPSRLTDYAYRVGIFHSSSSFERNPHVFLCLLAGWIQKEIESSPPHSKVIYTDSIWFQMIIVDQR